MVAPLGFAFGGLFPLLTLGLARMSYTEPWNTGDMMIFLAPSILLCVFSIFVLLSASSRRKDEARPLVSGDAGGGGGMVAQYNYALDVLEMWPDKTQQSSASIWGLLITAGHSTLTWACAAFICRNITATSRFAGILVSAEFLGNLICAVLLELVGNAEICVGAAGPWASK